MSPARWSKEQRADFLRSLGAAEPVVEELLAHNENAFVAPGDDVQFPLADEPFVAAWEAYAAQAVVEGVWPTLRQKLVQLRFPVQAGMSREPGYQAATRRGVWPSTEQPGVHLDAPGELALTLHATPAGRLPILSTRRRSDFETLLRALLYRNEPEPIPPSMGAAMAAGFNNWDRVATLRRTWESTNPSEPWEAEFARIIPRKELYQDRFMILSDGPYSGVPAADLGLEEEKWRALSLTIRREHECTHYFTRRVFGSMRNHLLDELLADYFGIRAAAGRFRADWFLRFMGLEHYPLCRAGGRVLNYRGEPPLSDEAFSMQQRLVCLAAERLEKWDLPGRSSAESLAVLASFCLEQIAAGDLPSPIKVEPKLG